MEETMKLDTLEEILQEVKEVAEYDGRDLRPWLYREILLNALKFKRDDLDIPDLKVVNRAMDEFRYAARVFKPYRSVRKVSIFGSARTPEDDPHYKMAAGFSRRMVEESFMAITGAVAGIMKAGIEGAGPENSFGVNILLPFEGANNIMQDDPKLVTFRFFHQENFVRHGSRRLCLVPRRLRHARRRVRGVDIIADRQGATDASGLDGASRRQLLGNLGPVRL